MLIWLLLYRKQINWSGLAYYAGNILLISHFYVGLNNTRVDKSLKIFTVLSTAKGTYSLSI